MTDNPLRDRVNSVEIPYTPSSGPTSRADGRTRAFLAVVCFIMFVQGIVYIGRYALTNPFVDEWEFVPVLLGDQARGPWLWQLHNEHRFPLPRLIYLGLFRATGDLRVGCFVSFLGISFLAVGMIRLARIVRGRSSVVDAVFPLFLMHTGQGENLYMGYQLCFMLVAVLAGALLAVIVNFGSAGQNHFRSALVATVLGWLLLACGAAGLAYGVAGAAWATLLALMGVMKMWQRGIVLAFAGIAPLYIVVYFQGYVRPGHHPPAAGVIESIRIALQAQAMALGPAATGLWPAIGIVILIVGIAICCRLAWNLPRRRFDLSSIGLLLFISAGAAVAFGIGWGRSGFHADMGFAWRYGWITWPPIAAAYFTRLRLADRFSNCLPQALFLLAVVMGPVNSISGFRDAETKVRPAEAAWEADVRAGLTAEEVVARRYGDAVPRAMIESMRLMRDRRYTYYESLGREHP